MEILKRVRNVPEIDFGKRVSSDKLTLSPYIQ